ncbi:MAG: hypothetical protein LLG97_19315 [Deltaproteobacteria bacterium]|nr:hypothetical protein [Deltaproteobacteria bacterium]
MDFFEKSEFNDDIRRIDALLASGIFDVRNVASPLVRSAFIEVLICLRDLMYKAQKYARCIDFVDDVTIRDEVKEARRRCLFLLRVPANLSASPHHARLCKSERSSGPPVAAAEFRR